MLEERLNDMILSVEDQVGLVKIKIKAIKKELKEIDKKIRDNKYVDNAYVRADKSRLNKELSETDIRLYKLKKILYRLRVCEKILNNEEQ